MAGKSLDIETIFVSDRDWLAEHVGQVYREYNTHRSQWLDEKRELRNYLFATDTRSTSNQTLPWKNSTTLPKLTQIYDNLIANYFAALFPNEDWLEWESKSQDDADKDKAAIVKEWMKAKLKQQDFETTALTLLADFVRDGNVFADTEYVHDLTIDSIGGSTVKYTGPYIRRISPIDMVFNPTAPTFDDSFKIKRKITTLGELAKDIRDNPDAGYLQEAFDMIVQDRQQFQRLDKGTRLKSDGYQVDGFSSIEHYYGTQYVELLEFHGNYFDVDKNELHDNVIVVIADRRKVILHKTNPSWTGTSRIKHAGWRLRPDNLYAMGPLDNLVGMQYRIDHLENLRADAFDMIAYPLVKISGVVDDFDYAPGERIYVSEEGDVGFMSPDVTVLQADTQIQMLENRMEEMAGAPRQAMGIRTPGEKTKYEVQTLENAASRIFQSKINHFERTFLRPLLNDFLELGRRYTDTAEHIKVMNDELAVATFKTVSKDDLNVNGTLEPKGATHFARKANMLQNLTNYANSALAQDPSVNSHFSGVKLAHLIEELMELKKYDLVEPNIKITEEMQRQRLITSAENTLASEGTPVGQPVPQGQ